MATYIVRISPNNTRAVKDFENFQTEIQEHGTATWDKDAKNRIRAGHTLGFITGPTVNPTVTFYRVTTELSTNNRNSTWDTEIYTTSQAVQHDINTRQVIVLTQQGSSEQSFWDYKTSCNYKTRYMPRGTTKAKVHVQCP